MGGAQYARSRKGKSIGAVGYFCEAVEFPPAGSVVTDAEFKRAIGVLLALGHACWNCAVPGRIYPHDMGKSISHFVLAAREFLSIYIMQKQKKFKVIRGGVNL
jgi:hypothetical protein